MDAKIAYCATLDGIGSYMIELSNEWFRQNQVGFEAATTLAGQIGAQHELYHELLDNDAITTEVLRMLTEEHLAAEQSETFDALVQASEAVPYQELGKQDVALESALARVGIQLADVEESLKPDIERIEKERQLLVERIPSLASLSADLAEQSINELLADARQPLLAEQTQLCLRQVVVMDFFGRYGAAWPVPQFINAEERVARATPEVTFSVSSQPQEAPIETSVAESLEVAPQVMAAWETALRAAASTAIEQLEEWTLMEGPEIAWSRVSQRSTSGKVGTGTMMEKAIERGILAKDQTGKQAVIKTHQLVCMLLQDQPVYRTATTTKARSKRVPAIVDELVQAYLDAKSS
jgi:hypothetical protein